MKYARSYGFTLIELMIVLVVLAVIVAIAYPAYTTYMIQTRRSDAQVALMLVANLEEKFFSACNQYTAALVNGNIPACNGLGYVDALTTEGHYLLTIDVSAATCGTPPGDGGCFVVTADPDNAATTARQKGNGDLRIDNAGLRQWDKDNNSTFSYKWSDK